MITYNVQEEGDTPDQSEELAPVPSSKAKVLSEDSTEESPKESEESIK